ncbi:MAG: dihydropteroate synthase [Bdellovibrionales bacterium]|nr:dihydropteroate synthase [Bdellovibrionales bacterium]
MKRVAFVGIVNVTPDSFSDGGHYFSPADAVARVHQLREAGADVIELGADSTRPGSLCTGPEEEWRRLEPILRSLEDLSDISLDTHFAATAQRAIDCGVRCINDVFPGSDREMYSLVAQSGVRYVLMHSRCAAPHVFSDPPKTPLKDRVHAFFEKTLGELSAEGVKREQIVLDPGYGGFVSSDPAESFLLLEEFGELSRYGLPLCIATSRKGFLKARGEARIEDRDPASALTALAAALQSRVDLYVRAHNIVLHRQFFQHANLFVNRADF